MYDYDHYLAFHPVGLDHELILEKHQRMIDGALRWQKVSRLANKEPKSSAITQLRPILTAILHLVTK